MKSRSPKTLVLCEGKDDELVMQTLASHSGMDQDLVFMQYGGESKLREYLKTLMARRGFQNREYSKILITRDADQNYDAAVQSLKDAIHEVFSVNVMTPGEWVELSTGSKISTCVICGPNQKGMIETLCLDAIRAKNPEQFTCLDSFIDCLETQWGHRPHEKVRFTLWTIIAQGKTAKDRLSISYAIKNLDFNWDNAAYDNLRQLFKEISE
jgi:hypothetical protein